MTAVDRIAYLAAALAAPVAQDDDSEHEQLRRLDDLRERIDVTRAVEAERAVGAPSGTAVVSETDATGFPSTLAAYATASSAPYEPSAWRPLNRAERRDQMRIQRASLATSTLARRKRATAR